MILFITIAWMKPPSHKILDIQYTVFLWYSTVLVFICENSTALSQFLLLMCFSFTFLFLEKLDFFFKLISYFLMIFLLNWHFYTAFLFLLILLWSNESKLLKTKQFKKNTRLYFYLIIISCFFHISGNDFFNVNPFQIKIIMPLLLFMEVITWSCYRK